MRRAAVGISADSSHPITGRHLCVKVDRYLERVYSPDRLLPPMRRTGAKGSGDFESIGWDEALDEIVSRWRSIIDVDGAEAILGYSYLGSMGVLDAFGTMQAVFNRLGATQLERSICGPQWFELTGLTAWPWSDPENLPDAETVVVWGMDPVSTSIHTWEFIRHARKANGAKLVVVDPYRSRTAAYADVHLRPHAGTDGALALAVGHVIVRDGLHDAAYVEEHTSDFDAYREAVESWTPERAATETGLAVDGIVEFARLYPRLGDPLPSGWASACSGRTGRVPRCGPSSASRPSPASGAGRPAASPALFPSDRSTFRHCRDQISRPAALAPST